MLSDNRASSRLTLDTEHLFQLGDDLHEVALIGHDLVDRLVGGRDLVYDVRVLTALDAGRLQREVRRHATSNGSLSFLRPVNPRPPQVPQGR